MPSIKRGHEMKKRFVLASLAVVLLWMNSFAFSPAHALEGEVKMQAKDLYYLAQRKTYRLGVRGGLISPSDTVNLNKDSTLDFGLEFDAKLNENLDSGPRFGIVSKKLLTGASDASYMALKFGYGARIYFLYWGEYGSTHGFFNAYATGQVD